MQVYPGEFLIVTGKSGSGKTTLVNIVTGLDRSTSGEIWVDGAPLHRFSAEKAAKLRGKTMGVVFQSFELLPTLTVLQNVMLPMDFAQRYSVREQRQRAMHAAGTGGYCRPCQEVSDSPFGRAAAASGDRPCHGK